MAEHMINNQLIEKYRVRWKEYADKSEYPSSGCLAATWSEFLPTAFNAIDSLTQQRDDLLEACKEIVVAIQKWNDGDYSLGDFIEISDMAEAAIAKAKKH